MRRLEPLGAAFLAAEDADPHTSMAIASIGVFDGPAPPQQDIVASYTATLSKLPEYRQKVRRFPFDLGLPVLVDDPDFDLGFHLRRTALPDPGGDAELFALMARVMSQRLDRDRPLWETWVVEGLAEGRWALISKIHHCLVDGVAGTELYHLLLSATPEPDVPLLLPLAEPTPGRTPVAVRMAADAIAQAGMIPAQVIRAAGTSARHPQATIVKALHLARGLSTLAGALVPADTSSLIGEVGQQRQYDATALAMSDVKAISHHFGATINDVALCAITAGFRDLLISRGETCTSNSVRSLVPVSVRAPGAEGERDNQVSCLIANLPVHLAEPDARLRAVTDQLSRLKRHHEADAGQALVELSRWQPFAIVSPVVLTAFKLPQRNIVTVTTNVPGPRIPLYLLGRRLQRMLPFVPITDRLRIGVAILSYSDELVIGITSDRDSHHDTDQVIAGARREIESLLHAATARPAEAERAAHRS